VVKTKSRNALGRGLSQIIPIKDEDKDIIFNEVDKVIEIELSKIVPNKFQPRREFNPIDIESLALSIKHHGLLQPIIVRKISDKYELIAGERRYRAFKYLNKTKIRAIIKEEISNESMLEYALIENIQRENLSPIEEAYAYKRLQDEFALSQNKIAERVGKSRSTITNLLRLLTLPDDVQEIIIREKIGTGIAKLLLSVDDEKDMRFFLQLVLEDELTVRDLKKLITEQKQLKKEKKNKLNKVNPNILKLEDALRNYFATEVKLKYNENKKSGKIEIYYYSNEELQRILEKMKEQLV